MSLNRIFWKGRLASPSSDPKIGRELPLETNPSASSLSDLIVNFLIDNGFVLAAIR
jgi:hypothetical protein